MMERASRYSELLAKAERKADKLRAEALGAGGAFKAADQEADSVSLGDGGFFSAQQVDIRQQAAYSVCCVTHVSTGEAGRDRCAGAWIRQQKSFGDW